jgi:hypothetical protein
MLRTALIIGTLWSVTNSILSSAPPRQGGMDMNPISTEGDVEDKNSSIRFLLCDLDGVIRPPLLGFYHMPLSCLTTDAVEDDVPEMDDHEAEGVGAGWGYSWRGFHNIHH